MTEVPSVESPVLTGHHCCARIGELPPEAAGGGAGGCALVSSQPPPTASVLHFTGKLRRQSL